MKPKTLLLILTVALIILSGAAYWAYTHDDGEKYAWDTNTDLTSLAVDSSGLRTQAGYVLDGRETYPTYHHPHHYCTIQASLHYSPQPDHITESDYTQSVLEGINNKSAITRTVLTHNNIPVLSAQTQDNNSVAYTIARQFNTAQTLLLITAECVSPDENQINNLANDIREHIRINNDNNSQY